MSGNERRRFIERLESRTFFSTTVHEPAAPVATSPANEEAGPNEVTLSISPRPKAVGALPPRPPLLPEDDGHVFESTIEAALDAFAVGVDTICTGHFPRDFLPFSRV